MLPAVMLLALCVKVNNGIMGLDMEQGVDATNAACLIVPVNVQYQFNISSSTEQVVTRQILTTARKKYIYISETKLHYLQCCSWPSWSHLPQNLFVLVVVKIDGSFLTVFTSKWLRVSIV